MKKTILFVNGHLDPGGCEKSLVDVLKKLDYERYEVDLLLLERAGDYLSDVPEEVNVKLYSLDNAFGDFRRCILESIQRHDSFSLFFRIWYTIGRKISVFFFKRLKKQFKDLKKSYDVIIAYRPGICTELVAFSFEGGKKVSWWHHGEMNLSERDVKKLYKAYQKIDVVVAVSKSSLKLLEDTFPDMKDKLVVIPNMIINSNLKKKAEEIVVNEFENASFKIISVGRISPEKNMILCPEIALYLKSKGYNFKWIIIGSGEDEKRVSNRIKDYELEENVIMLGKKSNPYPYIAKADVMIHPSLVESQGITILESMSLFTPVIAVASDGPKEFIMSGENGYLVNPNADEIVELIEKNYEKILCGVEIVKNAEETIGQFEPETIIKKIENIIDT